MTLRAIVQKSASGGGGANVLPPVTTNNTNIAATAGWSFISIRNGTGTPFTINLPSSPVAGQLVSIMDELCNAGTHNITINGNGKNIVAYGSATNSSIVIASNGGSVNPLAWDATSNTWTQFA